MYRVLDVEFAAKFRVRTERAWFITRCHSLQFGHATLVLMSAMCFFSQSSSIRGNEPLPTPIVNTLTALRQSEETDATTLLRDVPAQTIILGLGECKVLQFEASDEIDARLTSGWYCQVFTLGSGSGTLKKGLLLIGKCIGTSNVVISLRGKVIHLIVDVCRNKVDPPDAGYDGFIEIPPVPIEIDCGNVKAFELGNDEIQVTNFKQYICLASKVGSGSNVSTTALMLHGKSIGYTYVIVVTRRRVIVLNVNVESPNKSPTQATQSVAVQDDR